MPKHLTPEQVANLRALKAEGSSAQLVTYVDELLATQVWGIFNAWHREGESLLLGRTATSGWRRVGDWLMARQ